MQEIIQKYYDEFKGLPSERPIVRNRQLNDAFEVVVLKILYGKTLDITFDKEHAEDLAKYIIAPPDSAIDIFVEKGNSDDSSFDVIQVKNTALSESELRDAIAKMKRTISDYCSSPLNVTSESCRETLSASNLDSNNEKNCQYYIIHTGTLREFNGIKDDEHVINTVDLEILSKSVKDKVEEDILAVSGADQIMQFGDASDSQNAVVCSINCYQLATLNNKYYSTEVGRNILFGHNLRESLKPKSSKSYRGMKDTILRCPKNFWYYNNGITIIAEDVDLQRDDGGEVVGVRLKRFSIVNGAQTTSSLGLILQEAGRNRDQHLEGSLKKAFVIARILKVSDPDTENAIAIYNNTQNPITSRDMVANNIEQKALYERLIDTSYPQIFMEIRRGSKVPGGFNKLFLHRKTSNETIAQLAYAGFLFQPFTAKDKKAALFNNDYSQTEYTMNAIYHKVFHYDEHDISASGILFRKTKSEIDELLFAQQLYKDGKTYLKKTIQNRLTEEQQQLATADSDKKPAIQRLVDRDTAMLETIGVCMFYFVTTYYEFMDQYGIQWQQKRYDFDKFYNDKQYRAQMVKDMSDFFLVKTVQLLLDTAKRNDKNNINNWVRSAACQSVYLEALIDDIGFNMALEDAYARLMNTYKTVQL